MKEMTPTLPLLLNFSSLIKISEFFTKPIRQHVKWRSETFHIWIHVHVYEDLVMKFENMQLLEHRHSNALNHQLAFSENWSSVWKRRACNPWAWKPISEPSYLLCTTALIPPMCNNVLCIIHIQSSNRCIMDEIV